MLMPLWLDVLSNRLLRDESKELLFMALKRAGGICTTKSQAVSRCKVRPASP